MKKVIFLIILFSPACIYSQDPADSTKTPFTVGGEISFNSNGMAPVPAFSLGKPAISAGMGVNKGHFSYDPQFAYSLHFKPWVMDNWFHYRLVDRQKFMIRTGADVSLFFTEENFPDLKLIHAQRYLALEIMGAFKFRGKGEAGLMYWRDLGLDQGSLKGHFINLYVDRPDIGLGKIFETDLYVQLFYLDYTAENDGLFFAGKISPSLKGCPVHVFFQWVQALWSNIDPFPGFRWNAGVAYKF